jgi:hypothetical protein
VGTYDATEQNGHLLGCHSQAAEDFVLAPEVEKKSGTPASAIMPMA